MDTNTAPKMQCSPSCPFFPDMTCNSWEYDAEMPNIKRRKEKKLLKCCYDGHIITSWYTPCPKVLEEALSSSNN